jgi:hypothetical protein
VQARAHLEVEIAHGVADTAGAAKRSGGAVEGGEEAVSRRVNLAAAEAGKLTANDRMVVLNQLTPSSISERLRPLGRRRNVGEKNGRENPIGLDVSVEPFEEHPDRIRHRVRLPSEGRHVPILELDKLGTWDLVCDVSALR